MRYLTCRSNFTEEYNKISNKVYEHLVQQKVQQKVHQKVQQKVQNSYVALLIKRFVFTNLVEISLLIT